MLSAENLAIIESEGNRILELARRDPTRLVPQYPDWSIDDLVAHTASIHGRTTLVCEMLPTERISAPKRPEGVSVLDWYQGTLAGMVEALRVADPGTPVWGFAPGWTIGSWERRMVVETGVHRWDADQAFAGLTPLLDHVARSGLDEYAEMWLPRLEALPTLRVTATDLGDSWVYGEGEPAESIEGTASDIYLRLMSRPGIELPEEWAGAVDRLAPPPRR